MSAKSMACPYGVVCVYLRRVSPTVLLRDKNQRKSRSSFYLDHVESMGPAETKKSSGLEDARMRTADEMSQVTENDARQSTSLYKYYPRKIDDKSANNLQDVVAQEFIFWL